MTSSKIDLDGRVAIVTGSGSGIGRATALALSNAGAKVAIFEIVGERTDSIVAEIKGNGGQAMGITLDVSNQPAVNAAVAEVIKAWGQIDILHNNAGIMDDMALIEDADEKLWTRVFEVNVNGVFFCTKAVIPHMLARKSGSIINTASEAGLRGGAAGSTYTASKHAVVGLTRATSWEYSNQGIRCNAVCPGAVITNIVPNGLEALDKKGFDRTAPTRATAEHVAMPDQLAAAVLFLASDLANFVNGAILPVDGGWSAG